MPPLILILLHLDSYFFCLNTTICLSDELHSYGTFTERNWLFCTKQSLILTWGLSETYLAQCRMRRMASILVSGKEALQANSDRHLTASWNESMVAAKCFSNTFARRWIEGGWGRTTEARVERWKTERKSKIKIWWPWDESNQLPREIREVSHLTFSILLKFLRTYWRYGQ